LYAAILTVQNVAQRFKELGITTLYIKHWATDGNRTKTPRSGVQSTLRTLAHLDIKSEWIDAVTPIPSFSTFRKGGHGGHHLWIGLLKWFSVSKLPLYKKRRGAHCHFHCNRIRIVKFGKQSIFFD
jgi:hypothetical protein